MSAVLKLAWVIRYVEDVPATIEFYERAFGLKRRFLHETGVFGEMETGETRLAFCAEALVDNPDFPFTKVRATDPPPGGEIAFTTLDVEQAFARAVAAGAAPVTAPIRKPWGQIVSYVRDPNGFLVEICTPTNSGAST